MPSPSNPDRLWHWLGCLTALLALGCAGAVLLPT